MLTRTSRSASFGWASDPLSAVLADLHLTGTFFCNSQFGEPWSLSIAERDFASFHFVSVGECWLQTFPKRRRAEAVRLMPGDLVLAPRSPRQILSSGRRTTGTPIDHLPVRQISEVASSLQLGGPGRRWLVVCGGVRSSGFVGSTLFGLMPEVVILRAAESDAIVSNALESMRQESIAAKPGSATLMTRLAEIVIVHAIRKWMQTTETRKGWLAALRDPQIGSVIARVHDQPERPWSIAELSRLANLSRSRFSERFTRVLGEGPMHYVTRVRMHYARERLRSERVGIGALGSALGYESESAFTRAFKRHMGVTPASVRRTRAQRK